MHTQTPPNPEHAGTQHTPQHVYDFLEGGPLVRHLLPAPVYDRDEGVQPCKVGAALAGEGLPVRDGQPAALCQVAHQLQSQPMGGEAG